MIAGTQTKRLLAYCIKLLLTSAWMLVGTFGSSEAQYREACKAKYQTQQGWSNIYNVECNYLSGTELNTSTSSYQYDAFGAYAVIFWAKDQATVIKISTFLFCGINAFAGCAKGILGLDGQDQEGRSWKVCDPSMYFC